MRYFFEMKKRRISGQGFLEYALLLSVIALAIVIIATLGSTVFSNLYYHIMSEMFGGPIISAAAVHDGNDILVTLTVSTPVTVSVTDSHGVGPVTASCSGTCTVTLPGVGPGIGVVTITAPGGTFRTPY